MSNQMYTLMKSPSLSTAINPIKIGAFNVSHTLITLKGANVVRELNGSLRQMKGTRVPMIMFGGEIT